MSVPYTLPVPRSGYVCYSAQEMEGIASQTKIHFEKRTNVPFEVLKIRWGEFDDGTGIILTLFSLIKFYSRRKF